MSLLETEDASTCILGFVASDDKRTLLLPDPSVSDVISSERKTDRKLSECFPVEPEHQANDIVKPEKEFFFFKKKESST